MALCLFAFVPVQAEAQNTSVSRETSRSAMPEPEMGEVRVLTAPDALASPDAAPRRERVSPERIGDFLSRRATLVEKVESQPEVIATENATIWRSQYLLWMPKTEGDTGDAWSVRPIVRVINALQYDEARRRFQAMVALGLVDEENPRRQRPLTNPVTLVIASNNLQSVEPRTVTLEQAGHFENIAVADNAPPNPATLKVLLAGDDALNSQVELPVRRPTLNVSLNPRQILGLGLENTQLTVSAVGLTNPQGMTVSLSTGQGRFESPTLTLDGNGFATTTLRSSGLGATTIQASGAPFGEARSQIQMGFPWGFLLATLLGGFLGAVATRGGRASLLNSTVTGVASGFIAAVLYAVGVNVVGFQPVAQVGEAVSFAVAALGSILGPSIFRRKARIAPG